MSAFAKACRGLDTLLALDAERGYPRWLSTLRAGVAWPIGTMRNFATEPCTWRDVLVYDNLIGASDCIFELEYYVLATLTGANYIFHHPGYAGIFNVFYNANDNQLYIGSAYLISGVIRWAGVGTPYVTVGLHKIVISRIAGVLTISADGNILQTAAGTPISYTGSTAPISEFNGLIPSLKITTGQTVFSYPSWAEKTRLITTNGNVDMSTGVFKQASTAARWSVDTPISLSGTPAQYTFICRCKFVTAASGTQIGFCDGVPLSGNPNTSGISLTYNSAFGGNYIDFFVTYRKDGANVLAYTRCHAAGYLDRFVVWSCQVAGANGQQKLFADGVEVGTLINGTNITGTLGTYASLLRIGHPTAATAATTPNQVSHLAVKNYAMTAGQIAALTRTLTPAATPEIPADGAEGLQVSGAGYTASNGIYPLDDPLATGTARTWTLDADHWIEWIGGRWVIVTDPDPEAPFTGDPESYIPGPAYTGDASADPWDCVWTPAHQGETFPELDLRPAPTVTQVFGIEI